MSTPRPPAVGPSDVVAFEIESGPGCDAITMLPSGRHVIGRAPGATVRVHDPDVEPHHLLVDVTDDGVVSVLHLSGRLPVLVDREPLQSWSRVRDGSVIDLGSTRIRVGVPPSDPHPPHTGDVPGDPWQRMLVRSPRAVPFLALPGIDPPAPAPTPISSGAHTGMLVGALTGLVGGVVMAWFTGSVLAALFGVVAAVASGATWVIARVRRVREERRSRARAADELAAFEATVIASARRIRSHHVDTMVSVSRRLTAPDDHELWSRRSEHGDAFTVTLGRGDLERPVPIGAATDHDVETESDHMAMADRHRILHEVQVPAALDLGDREVVAIEGVHGAAVARSLVLQLAITTGPADWCLRAVVRDRRQWEWLGRLPHAGVVDGRSAVVDAGDPAAVSDLALGLDDGDERRAVIICDVPGLLATRTGPLRRSLDGGRPVTILLVVDDGSGLPAVCRSVLRLGGAGWGVARWTADLHDTVVSCTWASARVHASGVSAAVAERTAEQLARFVDPEDPTAAAGRLPSSVRLTELDGVPRTATDVVAAWASAGRDPSLAAVIGSSVDGVIEIDLVRDGPHGLVGGTTGSGKSELLRSLVVSLAARVGPEHLSFVLVDYKGGSTFDACARLPHTVGVVTDLDGGLAERALLSLDAELHRRERLLRAHGAADLAEYRALDHTEPLSRLVVVIDEFAALAVELPHFLSALVGVAQRGRSLGIHLLLATQRPAGVVDDAIRANTNLRIALRLHDTADALDVVGDTAPAGFARGLPGRSMLRLGPDEVVEFQAAGCTERGSRPLTDLAALVNEIEQAASSIGVAASHRPWLPPLGAVTIDDLDDLGDLGDGSVGVVDDPVGQCRRPLVWTATGNLALVGALGSGTTTTLVALGGVLCARSDTTLQVIDGRGDACLDVLAGAAACSGVVRLHERERLGRLLQRLEQVIDQRRSDAASETDRTEVLLVDGLAAVRRALDDPAAGDLAAALDRVLAEGPAVGVVTVAVVEPDGGGATAIARFGERWVFHLDDPTVGPMLGVPADRVPPEVPGRLVIASTGLAAQVLPAGDGVAVSGARGSGSTPAPRLAELPRRVVSADLVVASDPDGGGVAVGLRFDDLSVAHLDLVPGDRLVVAGPPGSGRSGLLAHLVASWSALHPDGVVSVLVGSERSPLAGSPWRREIGGVVDLASEIGRKAACDRVHHLVVVDDAERVHDERSQLHDLVGSRRSATVTVMIAGRADGLRSGFDHWTAPIRRDRLGFVMTATSELDADVLGVVPPRRCPITPRPGLAWMIQHGASVLVQTVAPELAPELVAVADPVRPVRVRPG